jgi:pimeloyl-ACP methyl ester carboxylesterase
MRVSGLREEGVDFEEVEVLTNGIRLHVVMAGPKHGIPVILLHGFPDFWLGWIRQLSGLAAAGCRVIVPDQRGYNLSDKPKGVRSYRLDTLVRDTVELFDALGYEKVNLVGHDWGAAVAWMLAAERPERLHHLAVLNVPHPAVMRRFLFRDFEQIRRSWYIFLFQVPYLPEAGMRARNWRNLTRALRGSGKKSTFTDEELDRYKEAWSEPGAATGMVNWYRAIVRYQPQWSKEMRVQIPTLMLWGTKDVALSQRMAQPSLEYCDQGRLVIFPEASHWVQRDAAADVNRRLVDLVFDRPEAA